MIRFAIHAVDVTFTAAACAALAALTLLVVADVALRYGMGAPLFFAHDLVILYLTPCVFFFGYGPTYWRREHLAVDILTARLPRRLRASSDLAGAVIGLFVFGLLVWVSWGRAWASFQRDEIIASIVPWPAWASYALVPIGSVAMVLACLGHTILAIAHIVAPDGSGAEDGHHQAADR